MPTSELHIQAAEFLLRVFAGILFFFQGYDKLFRIKIQGVIEAFMNDAARYNVPQPIVVLLSWFTSISELVGGFFLICGIFVFPSLCLLGMDMLLVCVAFSFIQPMWDMRYVFPRLLLVGALFLLQFVPSWSLDSLFNISF